MTTSLWIHRSGPTTRVMDASSRLGEQLTVWRNPANVNGTMRAVLLALLALSLPGCSDSPGDEERLRATHEVSQRFLSFAVDMDQLVGGTFWDPAGGPNTVPVPPYDFSRERLRNLVRPLAPAYMRLGGSASDHTYYDLSDSPVAGPPAPWELVLTRKQWDDAHAFARDLGLEVIFTVAAGAGPRDNLRRWSDANARELLTYTAERDYPLAALEFGNEPNLFAVRAGIAGYTAEEFAVDLATFRSLRDEILPHIPVFAPGNIYTRTQGENVFGNQVFGPRATETLPLIGGDIDGVNYHYYAATSTRCPTGPRITPETALEPDYVDGVDETVAAIDALREANAPGLPIWLTETGGQSCGGQVGVADRFVNTFWFLNTLGRLALHGHGVVVRQTLSGSTYGLIDELTLEPRPDYWAALLWRQLMGTQVLELPSIDLDADLRVYAHCQREGAQGAVSLLAINLNEASPATLSLAALGLPPRAELYLGTATELAASDMKLNGTPLIANDDGTPPALEGLPHQGEELSIPPSAWLFATIPDAGIGACGA